MNVLGLLLLVLCVSSLNCIKSRFRSVKCVSHNESVVVFRYCYLKAYSRAFVSFNYGFTRLVPYVKPIDIKSSIKYRYGTIYREIMHSEFEWCSITDGTTSNLVARTFAAIFKSSAPKLFQLCPFPAGEFDIVNMSMNDNNWPSPIPSGYYRVELTIANVWNLLIDGEIVSDIKTSF